MSLIPNSNLLIRSINSFYQEEFCQIAEDSFKGSSLERENIINYLENSVYQSFGAFINHILVGFVVVQVYNHEADIILLAVSQKYKRHGIGKKLLQSICSLFELNNIFVEVAIDNEDGIYFYQNIGFKQIGFRKDYYTRFGNQKIGALTLKLNVSRETS